MVVYNSETTPPEHHYRVSRNELEAILRQHFDDEGLPHPEGRLFIHREHEPAVEMGSGDLLVTIIGDAPELVPPHHHHHGGRP